jgi:hypothetical protein
MGRETVSQGSGRRCRFCNKEISAARLEALPETVMCVECARRNPPAPVDVRKLDISEASPINSNGFAPKD